MKDTPLIFRLMPALYRNRDADTDDPPAAASKVVGDARTAKRDREAHPRRALLTISKVVQEARAAQRDREAGPSGALLALSTVLDDARATIKADIDALYRDWFVETCDPRLLPLIGELVGLLPFEREAHALRAMVAETIAFRQRKGSVAAIERRLATLVGWPVRLCKGERPGEIAVEVWRDEVLAFRGAVPQPVPRDLPWACYHLDALGRDVRLVNPPRPYPGLDAPFVAALDAPVPLACESPPDALARAFAVYLGSYGEPLPPETVVAGDLSEWQWQPAADASDVRAVVDPVLGRLVLLDGSAPSSIDYVRGAPARIGGGPYEREPVAAAENAWLAYVHAAAPPEAALAEDRPPAFASLRDALAAFDAVPGPGMIRILDSAYYDVAGVEIGTVPDACPPDPDAPRRLVVEASGGETPCLVGAFALRGHDPGLVVTFAGLWIDGTLTLGGMVTLELEHCTVHPRGARVADEEAPAVAAEQDADRVHLTLRHCLSGALHLPLEAELTITDSVVDGHDGSAVHGRARGRVARSTFIGAVALWRLKASDAIFDGSLDVADRLWGEIATSRVPGDARAPRRTACLVAEARVAWVSLERGAAGYASLGEEVDARLHTGGSEGHAMGAHHARREARRMALLREGAAGYLTPGASILLAGGSPR